MGNLKGDFKKKVTIVWLWNVTDFRLHVILEGLSDDQPVASVKMRNVEHLVKLNFRISFTKYLIFWLNSNTLLVKDCLVLWLLSIGRKDSHRLEGSFPLSLRNITTHTRTQTVSRGNLAHFVPLTTCFDSWLSLSVLLLLLSIRKQRPWHVGIYQARINKSPHLSLSVHVRTSDWSFPRKQKWIYREGGGWWGGGGVVVVSSWPQIWCDVPVPTTSCCSMF